MGFQKMEVHRIGATGIILQLEVKNGNLEMVIYGNNGNFCNMVRAVVY